LGKLDKPPARFGAAVILGRERLEELAHKPVDRGLALGRNHTNLVEDGFVDGECDVPGHDRSSYARSHSLRETVWRDNVTGKATPAAAQAVKPRQMRLVFLSMRMDIQDFRLSRRDLISLIASS
jgi:hypothetical protein